MWESRGCSCAWCGKLRRSVEKNAPTISSRASSTSKSKKPPPPRTPKPQTPQVNGRPRNSSAKPPPPNRPKPSGSLIKKKKQDKKETRREEKKKPPKKYTEPWQCENCQWANNVEEICKTTGCGTKRPPRYVVGQDPTGLYEEEDEAFLAMKKAEEELTAWLKSDGGTEGNSSSDEGAMSMEKFFDDKEAGDVLKPLMDELKQVEEVNAASAPSSSLSSEQMKPPSSVNGVSAHVKKRRPSTVLKKKAEEDLVLQLRQQVAQLQEENRTIQETLKNDQMSAEAENQILMDQLQEQVLNLQKENKALQQKLIEQARDSSKKLSLVEEAFVKQSSELRRREKDVKFLRQQLKLLLGSKPKYH